MKRIIVLLLIMVMCSQSFAAIVSDNDGSAFITKAEFDSLKNNFQAQIDNYNTSIDSKIDGAIASYLSGIQMASEFPQVIPWGSSGVKFKGLPSHARLGFLVPNTYYRPFANTADSAFRPWHYNLYGNGAEEQELMPGFIADYWKLDSNRQFIVEPFGVPSSAINVVFSSWADDADAACNGDFVQYCANADAQGKKEFWYDATTWSAYLTENVGDYLTCLGIGRCNGIQLDRIMYKGATHALQLASVIMGTDWDGNWYNVNGEWKKGVSTLADIRSEKRADQWSRTPTFEYLKKDPEVTIQYRIEPENGLLTIELRIAPICWTNSRLTGTEMDPIDDSEWTTSDAGWSGIWTFSYVNKEGIKSSPNGDFASMTATGTTVNGMGRYIPYNNCGEILINEDYGGEYFDGDCLWCKDTSTKWIERKLQEWRKSRGPIASNIIDINNAEDTRGQFNGGIHYSAGLFSDTSGSAYARSDCLSSSMETIGYLPVLKISPLESEMKKITDFYAPLYGNDTMSPYGKSYVDGACICKAATDGDNLRVKLKSTEETTLYFNKNPFTTCDAAGNMGYIANGTPYLAGNGVHVNANEAITIDIKDIHAEDRYYVKPDTATTILFESAVITQDS